MAGKRLPGSYQKLFSANVLSNLGNGVSSVAYPWIASSTSRGYMSMLLTEPNPSKGLWEGEIANYLLVGAAGGRGIIHHLRLIT